jgi:spore maturation protein A
MLNYLWSGMLLLGIVAAAYLGNLESVSEGVVNSAREAMELLFSMAGVVCLWNGLLEVAKSSGLMAQLTRGLRPVIRWLFPTLPQGHASIDYICANFIANLFGLGWACTPTGLQAMKALQQWNQEQGRAAGVATNEMCTFLLLNISSLQLIPVNMIAYRSQYGSANPVAVVGPALVATAITTGAAIGISKLMCGRENRRLGGSRE